MGSLLSASPPRTRRGTRSQSAVNARGAGTRASSGHAAPGQHEATPGGGYPAHPIAHQMSVRRRSPPTKPVETTEEVLALVNELVAGQDAAQQAI